MTTVGGKRQEKRKRIMSYFINAAIELMEKEGIENLTIRKVAERAKYNSATLYHYFSNLDELELFASVKCLDEYMRETPMHKSGEKNFREWYLEQWRVLIYRGMLAIMQSDNNKPTVEEAERKTVGYLGKALDAYQLK